MPSDHERLRGMGGTTVVATFASRYVEPIIDGEKTKTIRYGFGPVEPGDVLVMKDAETGEAFGQSFVKAIYEMTAETLVHPEITLLEDGHRDYEDVEELAEQLSEFYPDAEIGPGTELKIIEWSDVQEPDQEADGEEA